jgi:hypothetical protein
MLLIHSLQTRKASINYILKQHNNIKYNFILNIAKKRNNEINFLDATTQTKKYNIKYLELIAIKTILHNTTRHPIQHKMSTTKFMASKVNMHKLHHNNKIIEIDSSINCMPINTKRNSYKTEVYTNIPTQ